MLDNLAGSEELASSELIRDLRTLCSLDSADLDAIGEVLTDLPEEFQENELRSAMSARLRSLRTDPEKLNTSAKVARFLWEQWARLRLSKDQIVSDLQSLDIPSQQLANMQPLLNAMEQALGSLQRRQAEFHAIGIGTPRIDSAACVVDARAVFQSLKYDRELEENQAYFELDHFLPIAILEIVSELNEDKATHSYVLTESTLDQLCDILARAKKRLKIVKRHLRVAEDEKEGNNA